MSREEESELEFKTKCRRRFSHIRFIIQFFINKVKESKYIQAQQVLIVFIRVDAISAIEVDLLMCWFYLNVNKKRLPKSYSYMYRNL